MKKSAKNRKKVKNCENASAKEKSLPRWVAKRHAFLSFLLREKGDREAVDEE